MKLPTEIKTPIRIAVALTPTDIRVIRIKKTGWVGSLNEEIFDLDENEDLLKRKGFTAWIGLSADNYEGVKKNLLELKARNPKLKILMITKEVSE